MKSNQISIIIYNESKEDITNGILWLNRLFLANVSKIKVTFKSHKSPSQVQHFKSTYLSILPRMSNAAKPESATDRASMTYNWSSRLFSWRSILQSSLPAEQINSRMTATYLCLFTEKNYVFAWTCWHLANSCTSSTVNIQDLAVAPEVPLCEMLTFPRAYCIPTLHRDPFHITDLHHQKFLKNYQLFVCLSLESSYLARVLVE